MNWETLKKLFPFLIDKVLPTMPTHREDLYNFAKSCLDKDIAATQNELGCAEAVSYLLNHLKVPGFPPRGFLGTSDLFTWLLNSSAVFKVGDWLPGDIVISPSGHSTKGALHGHVGICGYHGIMSNNSMNGLFQQTYTDASWKEYYTEKLGFPVIYFRLV